MKKETEKKSGHTSLGETDRSTIVARTPVTGHWTTDDLSLSFSLSLSLFLSLFPLLKLPFSLNPDTGFYFISFHSRVNFHPLTDPSTVSHLDIRIYRHAMLKSLSLFLSFSLSLSLSLYFSERALTASLVSLSVVQSQIEVVFTRNTFTRETGSKSKRGTKTKERKGISLPHDLSVAVAFY